MAVDRPRSGDPAGTDLCRQAGLHAIARGASAETVGAERICMNILPMPDGAQARVHYHDGIETISYLLEGECSVYYGDRLEHRAVMRVGEQMFIPGRRAARALQRERRALHVDRGAFVGQRSGGHRDAARARRAVGGEAQASREGRLNRLGRVLRRKSKAS